MDAPGLQAASLSPATTGQLQAVLTHMYETQGQEAVLRVLPWQMLPLVGTNAIRAARTAPTRFTHEDLVCVIVITFAIVMVLDML